MIHVCYGLYDRDGHYSKFVGTSMVSIFENTNKPVTVHILHDNTLAVDNRDKFVRLAGGYGQKVEFCNVELTASEQIEKIKSFMPEWAKKNFSIGSIYRMLIPSSIDVDKIIYLDSDIIVNRDINDLWKIDIDAYPLAAIPECFNGMNAQKNFSLCKLGVVADDNYFNSGVLMFNLERLKRREDIFKAGFDFVSNHKECKLFDQDVLNYCFSDKALRLPADFNSFIRYERRKSRAIENKIYHFIGTFLGEGLGCNLGDKFNRLYFEYFVKTPWFNIETIGNTFKAIENATKTKQASLLKIAKLIGKKKRVFMTKEKNIGAIRAIFEVRDDETVINASDTHALMDLVKVLKPRNSICFILSGGYSGFRQFLLGRKFVEGVDFIDAMPFLIGGRTDSHSIVRAM